MQRWLDGEDDEFTGAHGRVQGKVFTKLRDNARHRSKAKDELTYLVAIRPLKGETERDRPGGEPSHLASARHAISADRCLRGTHFRSGGPVS